MAKESGRLMLWGVERSDKKRRKTKLWSVKRKSSDDKVK